jgi:hypothetical protein
MTECYPAWMTHFYACVCPRERSMFMRPQAAAGNRSIKTWHLHIHNLTNCHSLMEEIMIVFRRTVIFTLLWFVTKYPLSLLIMLRIIFACTNISPALKQTFCVIIFLPKILCISDNVSQHVYGWCAKMQSVPWREGLLTGSWQKHDIE